MTFWEKIKVLNSKVWAFLEPLVKLFLTTAGQILAEIALREVKSLMLSDFTPAEKREQAYKRISTELMGRGIQLGASVIYAAIEIAVQKIK